MTKRKNVKYTTKINYRSTILSAASFPMTVTITIIQILITHNTAVTHGSRQYKDKNIFRQSLENQNVQRIPSLPSTSLESEL